MKLRWNRTVAGLCGVLLPVVLLAACAQDDRSAPGSADDPAGHRPSDPATADGRTDPGRAESEEPGQAASDLAEIAEGLAGRQRDPDEAVRGADFGWPQCPRGLGIPERPTEGMPMPVEEAEYVVIGLTNGPGFTPNPCLSDQVDWARERSLLVGAYAVGSFPDDTTLARHGSAGPYDSSTATGALQNTGYAQAAFNVASMEAAGLLTPVVWLDIEPVPDFGWSDDASANTAVVQGLARGYTDAGYEIGVYSTPALWEQIVGDLELGLPEWRAAGHTSAQEALARCGEDWVIQGGSAVLAQWVESDRDHNVTCPGVAGDLRRWFHQY